MMKYQIEIQTFEKLIEGGYVYVDKTALVHELVNTGKYISCAGRAASASRCC